MTPQQLEEQIRKQSLSNYKEFSKKQWKLRNTGQIEYYDTKHLPINLNV